MSIESLLRSAERNHSVIMLLDLAIERETDAAELAKLRETRAFLVVGVHVDALVAAEAECRKMAANWFTDRDPSWLIQSADFFHEALVAKEAEQAAMVRPAVLVDVDALEKEILGL